MHRLPDYIRTASSVAFAIAATMGLRFLVLYTEAFFGCVRPIDGFSLVQTAFFVGTVCGYVLCFLASFARRRSLEIIMASSYATAFAGVVCLALGSCLFAEPDSAPYLLVAGTGLVSFAVSAGDVFAIHGLVGLPRSTSAVVVAVGFACGALAARFVAYLADVRIALIVVLLAWSVSAFIGFRTILPAAVSSGPASPPSRSSLLELCWLGLYLLAFSLITGVSSALFGGEHFGVDLRRNITLFAIVLAAAFVLLLNAACGKRFRVSTLFLAGSAVILVSLAAAPFFPNQVDLLVSYVIFAVFFVALISSRVFAVEIHKATGVSLTASLSLLLASCQLIQVFGHMAGLVLNEESYKEHALMVFMLCAVPLMAVLLVFLARKNISADASADLDPRFVRPDARDGGDARRDSVNVEEERGAALERIARQAGCTRREIDVFLLVMEGRTREGIAKALYISPHTVRTHTQSIYRKFEVGGKQQLIDVVRSALFEGRFPEQDPPEGDRR